ncbi:MAG: crossover junction endodeoxyribonuclease RuvC [Chloroflexi bacterium]|nr:crossover junction endodeoxyribonuclease RuvC [Chloroflexota bacterium]
MGIDPGLVTTGYGVVEVSGRATTLVAAGTVRGGSERKPLEERLLALHQGLLAVMEEHHPEAVALEEVYSHYDHPATAVLMGHARGVICLAAARCGVPIFSYAATHIKSSLVGSGHASKAQMQRMVQMRLNLTELPEPHDVADALALALCHAAIAGSPLAALAGSKKREARSGKT